MPSGYTSDIHDGKDVSFQDFALTCARAFGATIMQRDEPLGSKPRLREASAHHRDSLTKARARLAEVKAWSDDEAERQANAAHSEAISQWRKSTERTVGLRERYGSMLDQALAWTPPTDEHRELKEFMVKQLRESLDFDCHDRPRPERKSGEEFRAEQEAAAQWSVDYHAKGVRDEAKRVRGANAWITALWESLGMEVNR